MLVFSEMLKSFINENKISVKKLAAELQMDRTLIQKYMSGSRLPKSYREVEKISEGMLLLPGQEKELLEAYYREAYGARNFEGYMKIKELLEGVQNFQINPVMDQSLKTTKAYEQNPQDFEKETEQGETKMICGRMAVQYAFLQLVQTAYADWNDSEKLKICMILQPEREDFIWLIHDVVNQKQVLLEHIFCMDKNGNDNDNIARIFSVLVLTLGKSEYRPYYYYDNVKSHMNETSLLPNLILAGEKAMLCNYAMDQGVLVGEKEIVSFLKTQYQSIRALTRKLDVERYSAQSMLMADTPMFKGKNCVEFCFFPRVVQALDGEVRLLRKNSGNCRSYFSEQGLRKFMETGMLPNYLDQISLKPDMKQRLRILAYLIECIKTENYQIYMADERKLSMDMHISIGASEDGNVMFWCSDCDYGRRVRIKEKTISNSVFGFEKYAIENDWVYDREITLKRMERMYQEYFLSRKFD